MNYYERHLGDYARDTAHLSMLEHGAYTVLLDRLYATEQGIPQDQAHRVARARSKEERAAVDAVLTEFFVLEEGAYIQRRALGEIAKAQARIKAARENGRTGGRPKKNPEQTQPEPAGLSPETQVEALHLTTSPLPSLREGAPARKPTRKCPKDWQLTDDLRQAMRTECPAVDLDRETKKFRDHTYATARVDWDGTWRNWIRKAAEMGVPRGSSPPGRPSGISDERDWQDLRHRAQKIGFRDPREGESVGAYQTLLGRAEHDARMGRKDGPAGVANLLERRA